MNVLQRKAWALLVVLAHCGGAAAGHAAPSPIRPYYDFVHWYSMGRTDLALEQFATDAIVVAGPFCTEDHPCVGRAAIQARYFGALASRRAALPLTGQRFDGGLLRTTGAAAGEVVFEGQRMRWRAGHVFEFRDDRIVALRVEWMFADTPLPRRIAGWPP